MKRLVKKNINTPEEYNRLFKKSKEYSEFDLKRWKKMLLAFKGGKLIDLGCFDSPLCKIVKEKYPDSDIYGLDYAYEVIESLRKENPNINYIVDSVYNIPFTEEIFDYVTAGELLEHLDYPAEMIKEAVRILKPGGTLVVSTPLEETGIGEVDKDRHIWSFSEKDIMKLLSPYGEVKIEIMRSQQKPYKYHFPIILAWCKKYE